MQLDVEFKGLSEMLKMLEEVAPSVWALYQVQMEVALIRNSLWIGFSLVMSIALLIGSVMFAHLLREANNGRVKGDPFGYGMGLGISLASLGCMLFAMFFVVQYRIGLVLNPDYVALQKLLQDVLGSR